MDEMVLVDQGLIGRGVSGVRVAHLLLCVV